MVLDVCSISLTVSASPNSRHRDDGFISVTGPVTNGSCINLSLHTLNNVGDTISSPSIVYGGSHAAPYFRSSISLSGLGSDPGGSVAPCPVAPLTGGGNSLALENSGGTLTVCPNPNRGDQLFLSLSEVASDVHTVSVDIFDMTGKRTTARAVAVVDGDLKTTLDLQGSLSSGMYMVNIAAGDKTYTERLVIQP